MDACRRYGIKRYHQVSTDEVYGDLSLERLGYDLRCAMNPSKIEKELGWKPKYNFDTGIVQTIKWNVENKM